MISKRAAIFFIALSLPLLAALWAPLPAQAGGLDDVEDRLVFEGFDQAEVRALFSRPEARFDPRPLEIKMRTLFRLNFSMEKDREPPSETQVHGIGR